MPAPQTDTGDYLRMLGGMLAVGSIALSAYHGAVRHCGSFKWGALWGLAGGLFNVVAPVVAVAQGFAKPLPSCRRK